VKIQNGIIAGLVVVSLTLTGCTTGVSDTGIIEESSWSLRANADDALVDEQNVQFGVYPNPKALKWMNVTLQVDGKLCADDGTKQWCGGPIQGIPYVTILRVLKDSYTVRVLDIYGNTVRSETHDGPPPEPYSGAAADMPGAATVDSPGGDTSQSTGTDSTPPDDVMLGTKLVIDAINAGLAKVGLQSRVPMPDASGLADFEKGDITVSNGTCADVADYLEDDFSDDHPGTDDYVFGPEAIHDCIEHGDCRIGQLVTRAMAEACANIPATANKSQAEMGVVGGGGAAVETLCSSGNDEIGSCVGSPLVLDLKGDGLQLKGRTAGASFRLTGGQAMNVGWLAGSDDALLALDLNGDGKITSGRELFGEATGGWAPDGFTALARHDENGDGVISAADSVFARLVAWLDDGDGQSQGHELVPLADVGVRSISLRATRSGEVDAFGNVLGLLGSASDAQNRRVPVVDVWFSMETSSLR